MTEIEKRLSEELQRSQSAQIEFADSLTILLHELIRQQNRIIEQQSMILQELRRPPKNDQLTEKLNQALVPFFNELKKSYQDSNEALLSGLKDSLMQLSRRL